MIKNYILDTNVLVHAPKSIYTFEDNNIIIPIICIEELDNLKKKEGIVGYHARAAIRELNEVRKLGDISKGIKLPGGGNLRIELNHMTPRDIPDGMSLDKNDNKILSIVKNLEEENRRKHRRKTETILVTKDLCIAIKGQALGLKVQDYENDKVEVDSIYKGWREITLTSDEIDQIYNKKKPFIVAPDFFEQPIYPNDFLHIISSDRKNHEILARYTGKAIIPLKYDKEKAWDLTPKNMEQKMAFELLMDPDIDLVTIIGGAGTGKTILSTAVALQKVIEEGAYRKIVFVRPVVPAGNDIGFLPGSEKDKLFPYMGSFYDAMEQLCSTKYKKDDIKKGSKKIEEKPKFSVEDFVEELRDRGAIEMKTFTYMRGRTLADSLIILDEAQEMTPHLAKLMLTRAGQGSKFVMIGDPSDNQIDNAFVDSKSNGLVYTVDKMKNSELTGHIKLENVERSALAKLAEELM